MVLPPLHRGHPWLSRFGRDVPTFASVLLDQVRAADSDPARLAAVREGAEALGVLRAQQGNSVAGLVEDLVALREHATSSSGSTAVDVALRLAVAAYVEELTALLASQATRDPLTGLPNRAAFDEALTHEVASAGRAAPPSLLLVDLDKFKAVNDNDGHLAGDAVLVAVAEVLRDNVRPSDLTCRLGGDEFAVVLPRTAPTKARAIADRLLAASREAAGLSSASARVTFSIGLGWLARPADAAQVVAAADVLLYAVKATGGDGVRGGLDDPSEP